MKTSLLLVLFIPSLAFTQTVYKCPNPFGAFILQQTPCENGQPITISNTTNGKGGNASRLVEYNKQLDNERKLKEEEEIEFKKSRDDRKALEESKRQYGIKNGVSNRDREREGLVELCREYPKRIYCIELEQFDR